MTDVDAPATSPDDGGVGSYPWVATGVVLAGTYVVVLDLTILAVALPSIGEDLAIGGAVDWVVTTYLLAVGVTQPATGWLADRLGKKNAYLGALAVFTVGSAVAATAPSLGVLLLGRVIQGFGGGAMIPVGMAMMTELFPPDRRGTALGIWGIAVMAAPALGPPVGGWLTEAVSWRAVFVINLPIGAAGVLAGWRLLRDVGHRDVRSFHWPGWLLGGGGALAIVVASRLSSTWGPGAPGTLGLMALGVGLLVAMVRVSLSHDNPLLDFRLFTVRTFSVSMTIVGLLRIAQYARLTFLPIELQVVRNMSAGEVGLLLVPGAIATAAMMPTGGWLADRIGARVPVLVGLTTLTGSMWALGGITPQTSTTTLIVIIVGNGLGNGLALMPNTVAAMNSLPTPMVAQAAALRSMLREVVAAVGTAALAALVVSRLGAVSPEVTTAAEVTASQDTFNLLFRIAASVVALCVLLSLWLPGRRRTRQDQAARSVEHEDIQRQLAQPVPTAASSDRSVPIDPREDI